MVRAVVDPDRLTVLRAANLFGRGQDRVVAQLSRRALAGLPLTVTDTVRTFVPVSDLAAVALEPAVRHRGRRLGAMSLPELRASCWRSWAWTSRSAWCLRRRVTRTDGSTPGTSSGGSAARRRDRSACARRCAPSSRSSRRTGCRPSTPRSRSSSLLGPAARRGGPSTQACLETGAVKGGRWAAALTEGLRDRLEVEADGEVLLTGSGSAALRLAVQASPVRSRPGTSPSAPFTFVATGEVLAQMGYRLRFCDVRQDTWTMDPLALAAALAPGDARVVVAVDALGPRRTTRAQQGVC
jgi:hypothetical protein